MILFYFNSVITLNFIFSKVWSIEIKNEIFNNYLCVPNAILPQGIFLEGLISKKFKVPCTYPVHNHDSVLSVWRLFVNVLLFCSCKEQCPLYKWTWKTVTPYMSKYLHIHIHMFYIYYSTISIIHLKVYLHIHIYIYIYICIKTPINSNLNT